ncbi:serine hydrolase [Rubripirellula amarantea]|uniref:Beta-lactamase n=1 Tax=Rubripirellula amarantea TaxID=2527999 RepID=A0A5C5WIU9_9BACT|nr:serine hydrolase [Rubripirellula amarantea]MDA8745465.1 serine hydrolase [Rubripirellula amarantea]TWT49752.1 Beta-lactamase precursor [Rubripirellula amarantea]
MRFASTVVRLLVFILPLGMTSVQGEELTEEIVSEMAGKLVEDNVVDGLSVGFLQGDRYGTYHFGRTSRSGRQPNNLTVYELGSISKLFTSLLVADAVVQGKIKLTDTIEADNKAGIKLPSYQGTGISWLDVCVHRSGLPRLPGDYQPASMNDPYRNYNSNEASKFLARHQLARQPGETQEYSNFAVSVLGYMIAELNHSDYETLLRDRIAKPLRMDDCTVTLSDAQKKRFARPHHPVGKGVQVWNFADLPGAGGIRSTLKDMMRFAKATIDPPDGPVGEAIELAWKQHSPADQSGSAMGLGWMIHPDGMTRWHNGETGGSHSIIVVNRELKVAVIVLANTAPGDTVDQLAMELVARTVPSHSPRDQPTEPDPSDANLERLVGRYQLAPTFVFDVSVQGDRVMVGITNQPTQEVFSDSPTMWSYRGVDAKLEFHFRGKGPAYALTLHQNGIKQKAKRIRD